MTKRFQTRTSRKSAENKAYPKQSESVIECSVARRDVKQDFIALQVTLEERAVAHLCEEIENICKRPIEASERSYVRNEVWAHSLSFAMGEWSSSATVRPASIISSRTLIKMSAQRSVNRRDARRFIYRGVGQRVMGPDECSIGTHFDHLNCIPYSQ